MRRDVLDDEEGSSDNFDYTDNDDVESDGDEEEILPNHPVTISPSTPAFDVLVVFLVWAPTTLIEPSSSY